MNRRRLNKTIASLDGVQGWLDDYALEAGARGEAMLAQHRHDGHAEIDVEAGKIDRYIILSDERGQKAALSIEYGRQPDDDGNGGMEGLFILHKATRLPRRK